MFSGDADAITYNIPVYTKCPVFSSVVKVIAQLFKLGTLKITVLYRVCCKLMQCDNC